jgi:hypothetical protein
VRAELILMGRRVDMARQARRRGLVVGIYILLVLLIAALWYFTHWREGFYWVVWAVIGACRLFLGGYYRGGLVKPFDNNPPRALQTRSPFLPLGLRVYVSALEDDREWRSDERELRQRDRAHYLAYQTIGMAVALQLLVALVRMKEPLVQAWMAMPPDQLYYGFAVIVLTLLLTLPQAILLWTEPDMAAD